MDLFGLNLRSVYLFKHLHVLHHTMGDQPVILFLVWVFFFKITVHDLQQKLYPFFSTFTFTYMICLGMTDLRDSI